MDDDDNNKWVYPEFLVLLLFLLFVPNQCSSLDSEGLVLLKFRERILRDPFNSLVSWSAKDGDFDHCSWFGVLCSDGKVVVINLKDLCLVGTIGPELGNLVFIKSIILRNNAFAGIIPSEIGYLEELEVLDLGYNYFTGPVPILENNLSLSILLLDNNAFLGGLSPELVQLQMLSEHQVDENRLCIASTKAICHSVSSPWYIQLHVVYWNRSPRVVTIPRERLLQYVSQPEEVVGRSLLQVRPAGKRKRSGKTRRHHSSSQTPSIALSPSHPPSPTPSPSPSPSPLSGPLLPAPAPRVVSDPPSLTASSPSPRHEVSRTKDHKVAIWSSAAGAFAFLIISVLAGFICRTSKGVTVKPWATGLSGQLQKAFVSGLPKLKRSELELACEDFSNIIGALNDGTVYKGTLSSGIEIAVVSSTVKSREHWSRNLEAQFRKKIETLSKVNHKNFVNLIGYCEEKKPFTRMMVFEYAPNGTLFEHLHIKEAERLDWGMRLRIIMGMSYSLEYMHQLNPPIPHKDLRSCSIYLSEDYATKISDFSFRNDLTETFIRSPSLQLLEPSLSDTESNIFNFGAVLLEIISGKIPFLEDNSSLADWVSDYLERDHIPREFVDPTLSSFQEEEVQRLFYVIRDCMNPNPKDRPKMTEISARLKEITKIGPDGAVPKLSPLWWAELEILSFEAN